MLEHQLTILHAVRFYRLRQYKLSLAWNCVPQVWLTWQSELGSRLYLFYTYLFLYLFQETWTPPVPIWMIAFVCLFIDWCWALSALNDFFFFNAMCNVPAAVWKSKNKRKPLQLNCALLLLPNLHGNIPHLDLVAPAVNTIKQMFSMAQRGLKTTHPASARCDIQVNADDRTDSHSLPA